MPVLIARGAGVRRRRRHDPWLFRELDVTVKAGDLVAVVGPPGSGRTTMLLALARRFRLNAGTVELHGRASLGYVPEVSAPESVFTVTEHVRERLMLLGRPRSAAAGVELHGLDPQKRGQDLSPYEKQVLGLVLAQLGEPAVIALDGYDNGLDSHERATLWQLLTDLTAAGTAVILTAREIDPTHVTTVIRLGGDPNPSETDKSDLDEVGGHAVASELEVPAPPITAGPPTSDAADTTTLSPHTPVAVDGVPPAGVPGVSVMPDSVAPEAVAEPSSKAEPSVVSAPTQAMEAEIVPGKQQESPPPPAEAAGDTSPGGAKR